MGKSPGDVTALKLVRTELARRLIDVGQADVRVMHGIVQIRGVVRSAKDGPADLKSELETIAKVLRGKQGIKDVVIDAALR